MKLLSVKIVIFAMMSVCNVLVHHLRSQVYSHVAALLNLRYSVMILHIMGQTVYGEQIPGLDTR